MIIKDILLPGLKTISIDAAMSEADRILREHNFRHLPVSDGRSLVGIISDRDVQRAMTTIISTDDKQQTVIQPHKKVQEYMSSPVHKMKVGEKIETLVKEMISRKISCMIIEDERGADIGIITTEDMLILLLEMLQKNAGPGQILRKLLGR